MLKRSWKKLAVVLAAGAVMLQAPTCIETTATVADVAQIMTAGGVFYLVTRVME